MRRVIRFSTSACAIGFGLLLGANVAASPDSDKELLDVLLKKGTISQEEYDKLVKIANEALKVYSNCTTCVLQFKFLI